MVEQFKVPWMANAKLRQNRLKQMREVGTEAPYERAYSPTIASVHHRFTYFSMVSLITLYLSLVS